MQEIQPNMSGLVKNIDAEIESRSLLKHPFYKMWSEGKLDREDLAFYSKEYFQLIKNVPEIVGNVESLATTASTRAIASAIRTDEIQHIDYWKRFASALGISEEILANYIGTSKSNCSISELLSLTKTSFGEAVGTMYALENEQPKISRIKLEGLKRFYGMDGNDETIYFREHEEADVKHATAWRKVLQNMDDENGQKVLNAAVASMNTQNTLLDSVMEICNLSYS